MKRKGLLRLIPLAFLLVMVFEFVIMQKVSEPYPAVIFPPFQHSSHEDSLKTTRFRLVAYGPEDKKVVIDHKDIFEFAPSMTGFFMLLNMSAQPPDVVPKHEMEAADKAYWKQLLLSRRTGALEKSDRQYDEALLWLENRVNTLAEMQVDSLKIEQQQYTMNWRQNSMDTSVTPLKTFVFSQINR